ncbi:restriction endonuclease subunit S [Lactobacillus delbrueckii subsp. bulgaricus]|uniref:restriction endonuclease subunit S n=1 Tax=Lactobacillus delbrueckii TaxID=1584 RepID=UPI00155EB4F2|nr:restriction endonuclease subunit S [Lactobacillus delbrueckii]NRD06747.1 restriction endonuclease subunit S [Lactobacillus delbrueckii subsp. bulgaricus]
MKDEKKAPKLRFKGFTDDWEQCKAKELFESKSKKDHSDLPVLSATQENGIVFRNNLDIDIKFDTHALSNYKVVSPGDYIISLRSFQGGFELSEKRGIISPAYTVFAFNNQEKNKQNSTFWKYLFKRYDFIESLKRLTFGIRDGKAISFNQFSTLKLSFPNFDEQNKIATLLHEIDRTITLHEEKKHQLERLKSALLQKMFADKSGYPDIRFEGFSDEWEQRKLGDVAKITAGGDINKGDLINKGKYPVIANGLNNNGIVGYSNKYKIDAPAVTITGRGTLGVATARFINFTPIVRLISIKSDLDPIYLENVINNTHFVIESTGVPQLTAPQVKRQTVILSNCHIEQTKIGSLFLTLDNAITLHDQKLNLLKLVKQSLLQNMFI